MSSYRISVCLTMMFIALTCIHDSFSLDHHRRARGINRENERNDESQEAYTAGFRFGDEFFNHPAPEMAAATEMKISNLDYGKKVDGCDRIVKDTMICMLCKDPITNSKYEQCSYVPQVKDRNRSYANSRSYSGKPRDDENDEISARLTNDRDRSENEDDTVPYERYNNDDAEDHSDYENSQKYTSDDEDDEKSDERESSQTSSLPLFRSAGYHDDRDKRINDHEDYDGQSSYETNDRQATNSQLKKQNDNSREERDDESPVNNKSTNNKKRGNCRKIEKDSMTCTVCTDPENGGNFEKCSYAHQPNDKLYKFSKSKSFGYPSRDDDEASETKNVSDVVTPAVTTTTTKKKNSHCRRVRKNETTVCTVCKDRKTGESSQQCEYDVKVLPTKRRISRNISALLSRS